MFEYVSLLSVVVAAVLAVAVGVVWYSPLFFGPMWMRSLGKSIADLDMPRREMLIATGKGLIAHLIFFCILAPFLGYVVTYDISLRAVGLLLVALIAVYLFVLAVWEGRPMSYVLVHVGYLAIVVLGGLSVMKYWPW